MKGEALKTALSHGKTTSGEALAQAARAYIDAHSEEKFSLRVMAGALFVNGSYLLRAISNMIQRFFTPYTSIRPE